MFFQPFSPIITVSFAISIRVALKRDNHQPRN